MCHKGVTWASKGCYKGDSMERHVEVHIRNDMSIVTGQDLQLNNGMSRVTSCDYLC